MSVLIILIVVSVLVAGTFLTFFVLSVKGGQYDDDYTPSVRMLFDDTKPQPKANAKSL
ncbi:cbb3-type cytochrome oxidase assembly protein CcoS [Flaviaesturariibacter aridisoli]|uniref:Cbb3-type cytochrome oxidase assembly protein CcoS n=1 Tax=Flaviaesturariibacter aridisoli TaxID=2545761 RepID=A0A4R4E7G5_9BACT|nr:cbb3-type cytochrome oxidase assembly protein CcoS [Flaviaesturariibacter aridisoli]TCZ74853.1 cbb3-type cytochrome oxidase assembly protein CcoS [Flaviaesturariibacter aridisoli]